MERLSITFDTRPQFRRFYTKFKKDSLLMTFYDGHDGKTLDLIFPDKETCEKMTQILEYELKQLKVYEK